MLDKAREEFNKYCDEIGCWYETEPYVFDVFKAGYEIGKSKQSEDDDK